MPLKNYRRCKITQEKIETNKKDHELLLGGIQLYTSGDKSITMICFMRRNS